MSSTTPCNVCLVNNLGVQSLEEGCMDQAIHYFKTALLQIKQEQETVEPPSVKQQCEYSSPSNSCWNEIQECLVPSRTNGPHGAQRNKEEEDGAFSSSTLMFSQGIRLPTTRTTTTLCLSQAAPIVIYNLALAVHIRGGNATKKAAALYQRAHQAAIGVCCYDSSTIRPTDEQQCLLDMTCLAILNNWSLLHQDDDDSDVNVLFQRQVRTVQGRSYWRCAGPASNSAPPLMLLQAMFQGFLWNATVQRILTQNTAAAA